MSNIEVSLFPAAQPLFLQLAAPTLPTLIGTNFTTTYLLTFSVRTFIIFFTNITPTPAPTAIPKYASSCGQYTITNMP
jgi:hypothetical protein